MLLDIKHHKEYLSDQKEFFFYVKTDYING